MNFKHLFTVIGLLFAFTMNAQNNAVLSGTVKTDQGKLVKGATIIIVGSAIKTTSNEEGRFSIENLEPREYNLSVTYKNFSRWSKILQLHLDKIPSLLC